MESIFKIEYLYIVISFIAGFYARVILQNLQLKVNLKQKLYEEKLQLYIKLNKAITDTLFLPDSKPGTLSEHLRRIMNLQLDNGILISNKVLELISKFRRGLKNPAKLTDDEFDTDTSQAISDIVIAMKKELGIKKLSKGLEKLLRTSRSN